MEFWTTAVDGGVLIATYENPPMNYFVAAAATELNEMIDGWISAEYRVIVLTGAVSGRFMTHYSVEELAALAADSVTLARLGTGLNTGYYALLQKLRDLPKPVIAAMNGDAMGGGFELCMACDIRILAAGDHRVGLPEVRLGIIPGGSGTQALTRLVGAARALELILRGRIVDPPTALALGLVHELADDALIRALVIANDLAGETPLALAMAKQAVLRGAELPLSEGLNVEARASVSTIASSQGLEKMREYLAIPLDERRAWLDRAR